MKGEEKMEDRRQQLEKLIGKHLKSAPVRRSSSRLWLGYWPQVNEKGIITAILDGDCIPDGATMVDWSTGKIHGTPVVVDGSHGFEAVLES
jgi:hypothetical protein